jgi:hypothetical protein
MKISQTRVQIGPHKGTPTLSASEKKPLMLKLNVQKPRPAGMPSPLKVIKPVKKPAIPAPAVSRSLKDEYSSLKEAAAVVQRIRLSAQQELELIRRTRADALKYQQETATKARSEAHQLILHTRLQTQREIEELIRQSSEEIQKVLADIRIIRITAQEELAAQRKFTNAARLHSMSLSIKEVLHKPEKKKKKQLVVVRA